MGSYPRREKAEQKARERADTVPVLTRGGRANGVEHIVTRLHSTRKFQRYAWRRLVTDLDSDSRNSSPLLCAVAFAIVSVFVFVMGTDRTQEERVTFSIDNARAGYLPPIIDPVSEPKKPS